MWLHQSYLTAIIFSNNKDRDTNTKRLSLQAKTLITNELVVLSNVPVFFFLCSVLECDMYLFTISCLQEPKLLCFFINILQ